MYQSPLFHAGLQKYWHKAVITRFTSLAKSETTDSYRSGEILCKDTTYDINLRFSSRE